MAAQVGVDVGSSAIKVVQLGGSGGKRTVEAMGLGVNPVGGWGETEAQKLSLAEAIRKTVGDAGIKLKRVRVALHEALVYTRVIDMPPLSEAELSSALSWEAEQYIPMPLSEVNLDWQILGSREMTDSDSKALKRRRMAVLLVAAPKKLIDKVVGVMQLAGLDPVGLETDMLALTRAVVPFDWFDEAHHKSAQGKPILVCHLGAAGTEIGVVEAGQPVFIFATATGGTGLTRAIAGGLKLDFAQAEQYKRTYGLLDDPLEGKIRQVLMEPMTMIVNELKRAMSFYVAHAQVAVPMKQLILSGGGAQLPGLGGYLAGQLNLEAMTANPTAKMSWNSQVRNRWVGIESVFSVAVGLALGE